MPTAATNPPGLTATPILSTPSKKKTPEQIARISERRRERKGEERTERERSALALAQELLILADLQGFTPWRAELNALAARVRKSGKRTPDRDVEALTKSLGSPLNRNGATAGDLAEDTNIPVGEVQKMLDVMCDLGTVRRRPKEMPEIARGRTIWLYSLTGAKPITTQVLP